MSAKMINPKGAEALLKSVAAALLILLWLPCPASAQAGRARGRTTEAARRGAMKCVGRRARLGEDWVGVLAGRHQRGRLTGRATAVSWGRPAADCGGRVGGRLCTSSCDGFTPLVMDGSWTASDLCTLRKGTQRGPFQLRRVGVADEQSLAASRRVTAVAGAADLHGPTGRRAALRRSPIRPARLAVPSAAADATFIEYRPTAGDARARTQLTVSFERARKGGARMLWREGSAPPLVARSTHPSEEVSYTSGEATIAGTLFFPKGRPPTPPSCSAAGPVKPHAPTSTVVGRFFVEQGFAVLTTDKRGVGKSTGSYERATYIDYAADLSAGLRFLRGRADIRREGVGMWGHSEGAWIVPLAAAGAPQDAAFVILSAAIGVPPWQQELFLTDHVCAPRAIANRRSTTRSRSAPHVPGSRGKRAGWEELRGDCEAPRRTLAGVADRHDADRSTFLRQNRDLFHDPAPSLRRLRAPVLALIGQCDHFVPAQESRVALAQVFAADGELDYTISVIPNMGHGLQDECGDTDRKGLQVPGYSKEYLDVVRRWLREHAPARTVAGGRRAARRADKRRFKTERSAAAYS